MRLGATVAFHFIGRITVGSVWVKEIWTYGPSGVGIRMDDSLWDGSSCVSEAIWKSDRSHVVL